VEQPMFKIILAVMVFTLAACSDNSNESSKSTSGNAGVEATSTGETSDFGFIADTNLRACLDESGMTVESIHTVVCAGKGVQSLDGMEQLVSLKNLNVSHNQVSDLTPLTNVKSLQVFYATNNDIESIEALNALPELNAISLRSNKLSDANVFYTLPQLAKLYLQGNEELSLDMTKLSDDVIVAI
jgi:Leucine-rich repeat (LRR) protein